jgi:type IV secretory pathway VirD2 relaxase
MLFRTGDEVARATSIVRYTDNPHVHLLVRGVDEEGADLVISRDYISQGLRSRAEELVAIEPPS